MILQLSPTKDDIFATVGNYLKAVLPPGMLIEQGQTNRVAEPRPGDFLVMWPISNGRIGTNYDQTFDAVFTGEIVGKILTITAVNSNWTTPLAVGHTIFGVGVAADTIITSQGTGRGGLGTYVVSVSQNLSSEVLAAGYQTLEQSVEVVMQWDVHGDNSWDNTVLISTTFKDEVGCDLLAAGGFEIAPLYLDDPRQVPFPNAEQQIEMRWVITAHLQANQTVTIPQQFADQLVVTPISVDATYPV